MFSCQKQNNCERDYPPMPPHHIPCARLSEPVNLKLSQKAAIFLAAFLGAALAVCAAAIITKRDIE